MKQAIITAMISTRKTPNTIKRYGQTFYVDDDEGDDVSDALFDYHYYYMIHLFLFLFLLLVIYKILYKIFENS